MLRQKDHRTFAEVNLSNILHNIREIKKQLKPGVKFMAVVKADAYGHGAVAVSRAIERDVDYLSVATISEALELKREKIKAPIIILSEVPVSQAEVIVRHQLIQTVYTQKLAKALSWAAKKMNKRAHIHIKVDTGMGRVGVMAEQLPKLFDQISKLPNLKIEGIYTHLAKAESRNGFTTRQLKIFRAALSNIDTKGIILHAANSAAALYHQESHMGMVRIGLAMYGLYPTGGSRRVIELRPALEFKTRVVYVKSVPKGTPISYGCAYRTKKKTLIATLPVGYADGLPRALSNKGSILIRGRRYPIVGRVCMDMTLVDADGSSVFDGDEAVLIGRQGKGSISVDEVAKLADTINYEIVCGIGKRVPRVYIV